MDDSAIICDEFTDADTDEEANSYDKINFNEKKQPVIRKTFIFHLHFLLITIALLIAVII